jgi:hypothetical protein
MQDTLQREGTPSLNEIATRADVWYPIVDLVPKEYDVYRCFSPAQLTFPVKLNPSASKCTPIHASI